MAFFGTKANDAIISTDKTKASKERLVNRITNIKNALKKGDMPKQKAANLKKEVAAIVYELGARDEALDAIVKQITNDS